MIHRFIPQDIFVYVTFRIVQFVVITKSKTGVMWTSDNNMTSDFFTKNINKRMCIRYKHIVEKLLWIVEAKRVDSTAEVSIRQTTINGSESLVLWEG